MPRKVTIEDIEQMNREYLDCHSYAEVARRTGWSANTVRHYIYKDFGIIPEEQIKRFDPNTDMPIFSTEPFMGLVNYGELCVLTDDEKKEIEELWKELVV